MYLDTQPPDSCIDIEDVPEDEESLMKWISLIASTSRSRSYPLDVVHAKSSNRIEFNLWGTVCGSNLNAPSPLV